MFARSILLLLTIAGTAISVRAAESPEKKASLRSAIQEYVSKIVPKLQSLDITSVKVGEFPVESTTLVATAGPKISKVFIEELQRLGITVNLIGASHVVSGRYREATDSKGLVVVQIEVIIVDKEGKDIFSDSQGAIPGKLVVNDSEDLAVLTGSSVEFASAKEPMKPDEVIRQEIKKSIDQPHQESQIQNTELRVAPGSPFGFELLVQSQRGGDFVPRPIKCQNGLALVEIKEGEQYHIRLINESNETIAARVTIDGLSVFEFSTLRKPKKSADGLDEPAYSHFILPANPKKQAFLPIPGWHITDQKAETFLVTDYNNSALCRAKIPPSNSQLGTICVEFTSTSKEGTKGRSGTGFGEPVDTDYKPVNVGIGGNIATLSLRYSK